MALAAKTARAAPPSPPNRPRFEGPAASLHFHEPSVAVDRDTAGPPAVRTTVTEPPLTEAPGQPLLVLSGASVTVATRNGRPTSESEPHVPAMTMGLLAPATLAITVPLQGALQAHQLVSPTEASRPRPTSSSSFIPLNFNGSKTVWKQTRISHWRGASHSSLGLFI